MNKFRSRLLFALITLIISVLVGLGLLLGQIFNSFYINTFKDRMAKEVKLISIIIKDKGIQSKELEPILEEASETLNSHLTVINSEGDILQKAGNFKHNDERLINKVLKEYPDRKRGFEIVEEDEKVFYYGFPILNGNEHEGFLLASSPVESIMKTNQQIWGVLIASLGLALVLILLLGVRITSQYTRPIESATKVAIELAKGNYKARTYEDHLDETGMLSQSINILARNLQDMTRAQEMQQDRLQTLIENMGSGLILIDGRGYINLINRAFKETFGVHAGDLLFKIYYDAFEHSEIIEIVEEIFMTEVKVRKQLHIPLEIERRHFEIYGAPIIGINDEWKGIVLVFHDITELKKLEQMRKDFVANVSHELKTPITSIKGFSETLLDGAMDDRKTLESFLSIILKESDRLQSLIQDLLDLSKIEQQGFELNIHKLDLPELLEEVVLMLQHKADQKEVELILNIKMKEVIIHGDIHRLKQIFINLINNGIAYTPKGGSVTISVTSESDEAKIEVSDTGIGIREDEVPRIFERFYRVDKARSRNSGGTGLGLAIVKHLIEAHKGKIMVNSSVGQGTTFTVLLKKFLNED
ncbi:two-component system histidine kinase PnpS [Metabacillus arenae]|uniref:histidine kinase n=1 Tax=Metabacillus arenae TaxID=2771434 RepID=A0A926RXF8_9BACI|nr:ATP-binding protein [Metabacillus arenae]MBD1380087.1 PAS domain-containing protein [Metabacillus arenae]